MKLIGLAVAMAMVLAVNAQRSDAEPPISCENINKVMQDVSYRLCYGSYGSLLYGTPDYQWNETDMRKVVEIATSCPRSDKHNLSRFKKEIPDMLKGIERAKSVRLESEKKAERTRVKLLEFKGKIDSLSVESSGHNGYSWIDHTDLSNELNDIKRDFPRDFTPPKGYEIDTLQAILDDKIGAVNTELAEHKKREKEKRFAEARAYQTLLGADPGLADYELWVREGVNDTGLTFGQLLACVEITGGKGVVFNDKPLGKSITADSMMIQGENHAVKISLDKKEGYFFIHGIDVGKFQFRTVREKIYAIGILTSGCKEE